MRNIVRKSELGKDQVVYKEFNYVKSPYVISICDEGKYILNNMLTSEIVYYDSAEEIYKDSNYLIKKWFYFKEDIDPKSFVDGIVSIKNIESDFYNKYLICPDNYIIFTTMDCNARCPYCYEYDKTKISMDKETSLSVAKYIKNHYKSGDIIKLDWFGGEPLFNSSSIDIITEYLYQNNIPYTSGFTTNGYLFNKFSDYKLLNKWNTVGAQITLDGTSDHYNSIKNYIYKNTNAFDVVLSNIRRLLDLGINISVRINVSLENLNDIENLLKILCTEFNDQLDKNLEIYFSPLFEGIGDPPTIRSIDDKLKVSNKIIEYTEICKKYNCHVNLKDYVIMQNRHCSADRFASLTINPKGEFVTCEHYYSNRIGDVFNGLDDIQYKVNLWQSSKNFKDCKNCFKYPKCRNSINCPIENICCDESNIILEKHRVENSTKMIVKDWRNCHGA